MRKRDPTKEASRAPLRGMYALPGKPGEAVARLLPLELDVTVGEDGNVLLVSRDGALVMECTFDVATFLQIVDEQRLAAKPPITAPAPPRRLGRPPITSGELKRYPLSLYVTKAFKDDLVRAAKFSGRPLTAEVEARLRRTLEEDHGRDAEEIWLDILARQIMELVRRSWTSGGAEEEAEPKPKSRRAMYKEPGEAGEAARLLPVELDITRGDDGNVVLVYRHNGRVIREIPVSLAEARQLAEQLLAASSGGEKEQQTLIEPRRQPKSRRG